MWHKCGTEELEERNEVRPGQYNVHLHTFCPTFGVFVLATAPQPAFVLLPLFDELLEEDVDDDEEDSLLELVDSPSLSRRLPPLETTTTCLLAKVWSGVGTRIDKLQTRQPNLGSPLERNTQPAPTQK